MNRVHRNAPTSSVVFRLAERAFLLYNLSALPDERGRC
jgi:hypothetical protein